MITYGLCQRTTGYEKIQKNDLWLLSMFEDRHQNGYANVAWVIAKWMKRKGAGSQKDSQICCGQFISKIARKSRVLTDETIHSLSTPVYCRDLDRTTLRELIDSEDRLIPDIPVDDVQRVAAQRAPRVQRASMQDLYERMGSMEIRQEAIERMEYRQSYHWDRYQGVFEHMAGVYNVPLQGAYNPPGYAQPQYDQYYQQYYPQQPPQQQHDDEEDEKNCGGEEWKGNKKKAERFSRPGDENPIRTLGDYSRPRHEGYQNTIEHPDGNNVVPLRSDTIQLVQNGCSFHRLWSEDPNQHLKDFLQLVDSLDLDVSNRKRTCLNSAEVDATNTITFSLSSFDKPLSFNLDDFSSITGLKYSENYVSVAPKEIVRAGLATLGLVDEKDSTLSSTDLINLSLLRIRYFSPIWRVLMLHIVKCLGGKDYKNDNLKTFKPHHISATSFKIPSTSEVFLTSHMLKVANISTMPEQTLILPTKEVNAGNTTDKNVSNCLLSVRLVTSEKDSEFGVCYPIFESQDISTSNTHQQSLADSGSETRPSILKRGSYIPWASPFRWYLNRKRENRKWLNKAIDEGPYEFKEFTPSEIEEPRINDIKFLKVTVNTKFLNCLKPEWLKYVTQVYLAKRYTEDTYDDLFDCLQQFEKLVNASRANKLEKSYDPLVLVAHTGSSYRTTSPYYVTHPSSVIDYDDDYQRDVVQNTSEDPLTSAMIILSRAITQCFSNPTNNRLRTSSNARNQAIVQADRNDAGNIQRTLRTTSSGTIANVQCYNCSEKGHYACNCPKPRVQDLKYFVEQILLAKQDETGVILIDEQNDFLFADASRMEEIEELSKQEQTYQKQPKIINNTIGDDQIDSNIIFDEPNEDVNSGNVEYDNNVQESYVLEQLARNAYKEAEKQQIIAKKVQQQNTVENEEKYNDTVLDLETRAKKNEDVVSKISNSLQGMFMLGPKPMSFYDSNLKNGLGYVNPYTLKKAISQNPKLYDASCFIDSNIHVNIRVTEGILDDATKSQTKMKNKLNDPIAIEKKQNVCTIDYKKLNALYEDFVPQKEFFAKQKYFSSSFISYENPSTASSPSSHSETKPTVAPMPSANLMKLDLNKIENDFKTLFSLLQTNSKRERIFYTSSEEIWLTKFCQQEVKPILHKLHLNFEIFQK
ncbi:retrovirus-related pol polyprotein from transposon TNT 1-94 [Tanacetum coccineum]